jgi:hypothetical protein
MTLLRQLQDDAVNSQVDMTTLFRKARVLAARLKNPEFEQWIKHEMDGYPEEANLPAYRILRVDSKAYLIIGWMQIPSAAVMASQIPEEFRDYATTCYLHGPVSELTALVANRNGEQRELQSFWPQEVAINFGGVGYGDGRHPVQCLKAWQEISRARVAGIIETVRNKLLGFVLRIEAEAPGAGEAAPGQVPVPQEKVTQIFHTYVSGGVAHIGNQDSHGGANTLHVGSMHDSQIQQAGESSTQSGTFSRGSQGRVDVEKLVDTLSEHLGELNLDERTRRKAETQIATIKVQMEDAEPNVAIVAEAGKTLRNVTEGVIGNFIASALQPTVWHWVAQMMHTYFPK